MYDRQIEIDLSTRTSCRAPRSPDNVVKITDIAGKKVNRVAIGPAQTQFPRSDDAAKILRAELWLKTFRLLWLPAQNRC